MALPQPDFQPERKPKKRHLHAVGSEKPTRAEKAETGRLASITNLSDYRRQKQLKEQTFAYTGKGQVSFFSRVGSSVKNHKGRYAAGGIIATVFLGTALLISLFLGQFKMDFFSKNIDQTYLKRLNYDFDRRTQRFMLTLIMADIAGNVDGDPGQNRYFLAKPGYQGSIIAQLYKEKKTDKFFESIREKYGFQYANEGGTGRGRLVKIDTFNLTDYQIGQMLEGLTNPDGGLNPETVPQFEQRVIQAFETNQLARQEFHQMVRAETRWWQIVKRRHLRLWGKERLGITKWKIFENKREGIANRVNKAWSQRIVKNSQALRVVSCLLSPTLCPESNSLNDSKNRIGTSAPDGRLQEAFDDASTEADSDSSRTPLRRRLADQFTSRFTKIFSSKVAGIFFSGFNIADWAETLSGIHKVFAENKISKMVAVARAVEYATAFTTFQTMTDQLKSGENVSGEEADQTLKMFENAEQSDGWQLIEQENNSQTASLFSSSAYAQSDEEKSYAEQRSEVYDKVTPNMKVNSDTSGASEIESWYNGSLGPIIGPIADAYDSTIGQVAGPILDALGSAMSFVSDFFIDVLEATGLPIEDLMKSIGEELLELLGAVPICTGNESGPRLMNCTTGGAAVTNDGTLQALGGAAQTNSELQQRNNEIALQRNEEWRSLSAWQKIASTENPNSVLGQVIMSSPHNTNGLIASLKNFAFGWLPQNKSKQIASAVGGIGGQNSVNAISQLPENLFNVQPYDFSEAQLSAEPWGGASESQCAAEKSAREKLFNGASQAEQDANSSLCLFDDAVANVMFSMFTTEDDGGIGQTAEGSVGGSGVAGVECPADLSQTIQVAGTVYFQMPEAPNGEYSFDPGAPPAQRYGSKELVCVLYTVGKAYAAKYSGQSHLDIGDLNASGHKSHKVGVDVDVDAVGDIRAANHTAGNYSTEATIALGQMFVDTGLIKLIIWCDPGDGSGAAIQNYGNQIGKPVNVTCESGHQNHFHVRLNIPGGAPYGP